MHPMRIYCASHCRRRKSYGFCAYNFEYEKGQIVKDYQNDKDFADFVPTISNFEYLCTQCVYNVLHTAVGENLTVFAPTISRTKKWQIHMLVVKDLQNDKDCMSSPE